MNEVEVDLSAGSATTAGGNPKEGQFARKEKKIGNQSIVAKAR